MSDKICMACNLPKAKYQCGLCQGDFCKKCSRFLEEGAFSFYRSVPKELSHSVYCDGCYEESVAPAQESYQEIMSRAKGVYVFFAPSKKYPLLKKGKDSFLVKSCLDRDETILRMAFSAVELSFNAIVDVEVTAEKIRNQGYQKSSWTGSGVPAQIDEEKFQQRFDRG